MITILAAGAVPAGNVMVQRPCLAQRNPDHLALGLLGRLADGFGHFARLAVTEADAALLVADDDECRKAEALAALHHLGDAIDMHQLVDKLAVPLFAVILAITALGTFLSHIASRLSFAGEIRN